MLGWVKAFGLFWYRFVIGDDWTFALSVALGLVALAVLHRAGLEAWWLLPIVVAGVLSLSLWRSRQRA